MLPRSRWMLNVTGRPGSVSGTAMWSWAKIGAAIATHIKKFFIFVSCRLVSLGWLFLVNPDLAIHRLETHERTARSDPAPGHSVAAVDETAVPVLRLPGHRHGAGGQVEIGKHPAME